MSIPARVAQRFWELAEVSDGCWIWRGLIDKAGYGAGLKIDGKRESAHRIAYRLLVGPIPDGLHIDHLCRVTACVNPAHLEVVTQAENNRRKGLAQTHCRQGHEYTPANTYRRPGYGWRDCRTCIRQRSRVYQRRQALKRRTGLAS